MMIKKDFPGGNIKVNRIEGDCVYLEQEIRDTGEWWFYWNFCACGMEGRTISFFFENGDVVGIYGPCKSTDRINWEWAGAKTLRGNNCFVYTFSETETEVYFSFSIPYQMAEFERYLEKHESYPFETTIEIIAVSEKGRSVPVLRVGNNKSEKHIYFTARHHSCESTASYVLEGAIDFLCRNGEALLENYMFHVVPFVDLDGVEEGDQGKSRIPHDHYRDYSESPIYNITKELYSYVEKHPPYLYVDFHSPWKWGDGANEIYMVNSPSPDDKLENHFGEIWEDLTEQSKKGSKMPDDVITFHPIYNLKHGIGFNNEGRDAPLSTNFFHRKGAKLSVVIEFPYFGGSTVYRQDNLRGLGVDFVKALDKLLNELEEKSNEV